MENSEGSSCSVVSLVAASLPIVDVDLGAWGCFATVIRSLTTGHTDIIFRDRALPINKKRLLYFLSDIRAATSSASLSAPS